MLNYNFPKIRFCKKGHAIIGENIATRSGEPNTRWVTCRTCLQMRQKKRRRCPRISEAKLRLVMDALSDGKTMAQITGRRGGRYIGGRILPNMRLDAFCAANKKLGARIRAQSAKNAIAQRLAANLTRVIVAPSIIRAADDIMDAIEAAVPQYLPKDHRDDVIQNIWLDVLQRKLPRNEIASRVGQYIRAEYKVNHNAWGPRSLDVPIWIDSATTLLDTLSTEQGLWQ